MANILIIDQYAIMGGAQRILVDLASALRNAGNEVTALFPESGPVEAQLAEAGVSAGRYELAQLTSGRKDVRDKARYLTTALKSARSIRSAAQGRGFDVIYINGPRAMLPGVLAARSMRLAAVAAIHLIHEGMERSLLSWCFARPQVKLVTFCSRFAAEPFPSVGPKGKVLPNWVAPDFLNRPSSRLQSRAELGLGNDEIAIGVLGRVSKTKGQRLFLQAAVPLLDSNENLILCVAGGADFEDPQEELDLRALVGSGSSAAGRMRFLDKVDAVSFLDALDASVVPSIRPESFGLTAIESMARGVPVVATRRGGLQDSVVDGATGFLVEPEARVMRHAIESLIQDAGLRESMGRAGRARVSAEYNPDILIPATIEAVLGAAR